MNLIKRLIFALLFFPKVFIVALPYWLLTGEDYLMTDSFAWPLTQGDFE